MKGGQAAFFQICLNGQTGFQNVYHSFNLKGQLGIFEVGLLEAPAHMIVNNAVLPQRGDMLYGSWISH